MKPDNYTVCHSKRFYDTEFEAQVAAAHHNVEMRAYRCPGTNHYHLTHVDRTKRVGHGQKIAHCKKCGGYFSARRFGVHSSKCKG